MQIDEGSRQGTGRGVHNARPRPSSLPSIVSDFSIWRTILRKWWVVVLLAVAGGTLGVAYADAQPTDYEAESVVVATRSRIPREDLSSVLETIFPTDPILESVITDLGLGTSPQSLLSEGTLSADSEAGGSLVITALESLPDLARDLANSAARNFALVAEQEGLGTYAVLEARDASATNSGVMRQLVAIGVGLGGLIGASLIFLVYFMNQPILTEPEAVRELVSDASLAAHVRVTFLPRLPSTSQRSSERVARVTPKEIARATLRAAVGGSDQSLRVCCVVVESRRLGATTGRRNGLGRWRKSSRAHRTLLAQMNAKPYPEAETVPSPKGLEVSWIGSRDERLHEAIFHSDSMVVLVHADCRRTSLQFLAEELYASANSKRRVLLFITVTRSFF